jgi:Fe-S-cluster-containing dehydrogenase component
MQYGFVINQETCIGCHACTVACKAENDVPVGGFRTNVKYVEIGKFPQVKRNFLVQRCNHCTDAPCVTICPVNALSKRKDGIVDIDRDACIGCRACMQACPYDALYLNEDLGAVEKCHFCAHRIEKGLEPACVTVCPVGAIIPGDFHDPESKVSLLKRAQDLKVRRPEQGTGPNVMYIGASDVSLNPGVAARDSKLQIWSQRRQTKPENWPTSAASEPDAKEVLNADHKVEWGWPVALYLLTKGIAAGAAMIAPFFAMFNSSKSIPWWLPETVGLAFMLITVFLLIEDLKKPMHFYKLFTRPNWSSWLVKGGIVLTVFGALSALILVMGLIGPISLIEPLRWVNAFVGVFVAGYTAFLFKQCKGRDLWEAPGLFWHLIAQSVTAGAGFFLLVGMGNVVAVGAFAIGAISLGALHFVPTKEKDKTENFKQAMGFLEEARYGNMLVGQVTWWLIPALSFWATMQHFGLKNQNLVMGTLIEVFVAITALIVLFHYEQAFVRAGQLPPLS